MAASQGSRFWLRRRSGGRATELNVRANNPGTDIRLPRSSLTGKTLNTSALFLFFFFLSFLIDREEGRIEGGIFGSREGGSAGNAVPGGKM